MSINGDYYFGDDDDGDVVDYLVGDGDDAGFAAAAAEDEMGAEFFDGGRGGGGDADDEYALLTRRTDTSAAEARRGKDIQGIPWKRLQISRESYRQTRIELYKNYENVPSSGELMEKKCKQVEKGGNYYEFLYNSMMVKPMILHFQYVEKLHWWTNRFAYKAIGLIYRLQ